MVMAAFLSLFFADAQAAIHQCGSKLILEEFGHGFLKNYLKKLDSRLEMR